MHPTPFGESVDGLHDLAIEHRMDRRAPRVALARGNAEESVRIKPAAW